MEAGWGLAQPGSLENGRQQCLPRARVAEPVAIEPAWGLVPVGQSEAAPDRASRLYYAGA